MQIDVDAGDCDGIDGFGDVVVEVGADGVVGCADCPDCDSQPQLWMCTDWAMSYRSIG